MKLRRSQLGFGGPSAPAPVAVPVQPRVDPDAEKKRLAAEAAAIADAAASGRASTVRAGALLASQDQMERGLLAKTRRESAARELLG